MNSTLYYDLIAQQAASLARIEDMRKKIETGEGFERHCWEGMLRQYLAAMPHLDKQIADARR